MYLDTYNLHLYIKFSSCGKCDSPSPFTLSSLAVFLLVYCSPNQRRWNKQVNSTLQCLLLLQ
jgi:hypothetical protein